MPRISESEIERVKAESDLVALIQSRGTSLQRKGANWTGFCPFHDDQKTPNLIVTPGKGLFRCMAGQCGKAGNAIQFVQWFDGLSFRHAFELLSGGGKAAFAQSGGQAEKSTVPKLPCPLDSAAEDPKLLEQVANYYHERIETPNGKTALEYLTTRGLDDENMVRTFKIGLADRTLGLRLPHKNRLLGKALRERLESLGVFRKSSGHEHLNGCLTVPITNEKGETVQLYGRRLGKAAKDNRHLYLARPLAGIFNPEAFKKLALPGGRPQKSREIILCESILDALTFYRHGMDSVTCTFGTSGLSDELLQALLAAKIESVKFAYDNDHAGERAFLRDAEKLLTYGIQTHRIKFRWEQDANQFALEEGGEALRHAVQNSIWYGEGNACTPSRSPAGTPQKATAQKSAAPSKSENLVVQDDTRAPSSLVANLAANGVTDAAPEAENAAENAQGKPFSAAKEKSSSTPEVILEKSGDHHAVSFGQRLYRVGGLEKNNSLEVLRITLRLTNADDREGVQAHESLMHVDSLDLYRDGERRKFIERAAEETLLERDLLKRDLGKLLLLLEQAQETRLKSPELDTEHFKLSPEEESEALAFLRSPNLLENIAKAYDQAGIAGESNNLLAAYLACASRKLAKPLAIIIQSTSAAGKSTLMDAVLRFFPDEEQVKYSAMTGQSLYYLGETNLKHKILAIVEEEGAEKASYALKLLQSEGELTIASTGKDPKSGRMETQEYHVEGPVAIVFTTTSIDIDEELMNRCLVLTVDESREQTERIHQLQREARTIEGILAAEQRKEVMRVMQNAQRLLKPWKIANPYAKHLTFTSGRTRTRRDHEKYLTLIDAIALLHQHQREPVKHQVAGREIEMLRVTLADIEAANRLAPEVLGRSLDELPPQSRRLLESIKKLVSTKMTEGQMDQSSALFSRRELREFTAWSQMQIRRHLERLLDLEYLTTRGGRNGVAMKYEFLGELETSADGYQVGLLDLSKLKAEEAKTQQKSA